jgi:hypothetical protein
MAEVCLIFLLLEKRKLISFPVVLSFLEKSNHRGKSLFQKPGEMIEREARKNLSKSALADFLKSRSDFLLFRRSVFDNSWRKIIFTSGKN